MLLDVKEHPEYHGVFVTKTGEVYRRVEASLSSFGYHTVKLNLTGTKNVTVRRHTLVLETYRGPANGRVARHGPRGSSDDSLGNLSWGTQRENAQDMLRDETSTRGVKNSQAKLSDLGAREVYDRYHAGESGLSLAREFGISQPTVVDIAKRRTWRHIHD